jgi:UDPglucose--hexose-1-phosphate uridylyltransferase
MSLESPHRRLNPLTGEWVLVSPHRARRPWLGAVEKLPAASRPAFDPGCYLCPGNSRAQGVRNPAYEGTYVFDNDFPALLPQSPVETDSSLPWKRVEAESGVCRVLCYSPRHDRTLSDLEPEAMRAVVAMWIAQYAELSARPDIGYVQIFENKGESMGCSNPHPHGQIWATRGIPNELLKEDRGQASYRAEHCACLLCEVRAHEAEAKERLIVENDEWIAFVPFWAVWPFEALAMPRRHSATLLDLDSAQRDGLADLWQKLLRRYDRLFQVTMPLSCGFHQAPRGSADREAWHLHAHFYPPLLRSATVRKFMVGYEMLAGPQRDLTPEQAADRLRSA